MSAHHASRPLASTWQRLMSRWGRFARSLGLFSIRRKPIRRQSPLTIDRLEDRDAPSDTLSALMGNFGADGVDAWPRDLTREPFVLRGSVQMSLDDRAKATSAASVASLSSWLPKATASGNLRASDSAVINDLTTRFGLFDAASMLSAGQDSSSTNGSSAFFSDTFGRGTAASAGDGVFLGGRQQSLAPGNPAGDNSATLGNGGNAFDGSSPNQPADDTKPTISVSAGVKSASTTTVAPPAAPAPVDGDGDGVLQSVEMQAPNHGDGNHDGKQDATQKDVASLRTATSNAYVTIEAKGHTLTNVQAIRANRSGDYALPQGEFGFEIHDVAVGGSATVRLILPSSARPDAYLKEDPATGKLRPSPLTARPGYKSIATL